MAFADSFVPAYHFRLLYMSSAMVFPIMGALRKAYGGDWQVRYRCPHQHFIPVALHGLAVPRGYCPH